MKKQNENSNNRFPDYPHYDKQEDIFHQGAELIADPDQLLNSVSEKNESSINETESIMEAPVPQNLIEDEEDTIDEEKSDQNENDITDEELGLLDEVDEEFDQDSAPDEKRTYPVDFSGDDLDIPGAEEDDQDEEIGEGDEENNLYSLPD